MSGNLNGNLSGERSVWIHQVQVVASHAPSAHVVVHNVLNSHDILFHSFTIELLGVHASQA